MWPSKFFWKLFLGNALLVALAIVSLVWVIVEQIETQHFEDLTRQLTVQATTLRHAVGGRLAAAHAGELDALAKELGDGEPNGIRVTFVAADGTVLGDSRTEPEEMESQAEQPEIREALREGRGVSTRWSGAAQHEVQHVAVRVGPAEAPAGVVCVSMAVPSVGARLGAARKAVWAVAAIALVGAVGLALGLARLWSKPIGQITAAARRLSHGDLSTAADVPGSDELSLLAVSLNRMREHLAAQLATIDRQRRTLGSLLAQLNEGVIVADHEGRIALVNPEAVRLLNLAAPAGGGGGPRRANARAAKDSAVGAFASTGEDWPRGDGFVGQAVEQCIPQHDLQQMLLPGARTGVREMESAPAGPEGAAASAADPAIHETRLDVPGESGVVSVLARASDITLPESGGQDRPEGPSTGRLLVLTDITQLTRAIQLKTDFVANASHELRTPVSAIRASVETLLGLDLAREAESARRFLGIVERHSSRLEQMVGDLLDLSQLETPTAKFEPVALDLRRVFNELHVRFEDELEKKNLHWQVDVVTGCEGVKANPQLLRLVLENLADNAIKFTGPGGHIHVSATPRETSIIIELVDDGCGIPAEEQGRVFERFYQVDRSRGAGRGGTGLGLAIVKHAVSAMGGAVELRSAAGEGTRVSVTIPRGEGSPAVAARNGDD